ncbi:MAG: hypothetical protein LBK72_09320 [Bifidobacteriaceae bacterium]|nr:hypothetical protein [Bifidobacteriaceae bacterium]
MVGASGVHTINNDHVPVGLLRAMADPFALPPRAVAQFAENAQAIMLFGSLSRGEAAPMIHARAYPAKAKDLASAEANATAERFTLASGDAIHAGICAKDAIIMRLTGTVRKAKDHRAAAAELKKALGRRDVAPAAERAIRELVGQNPYDLLPSNTHSHPAPIGTPTRSRSPGFRPCPQQRSKHLVYFSTSLPSREYTPSTSSPIFLIALYTYELP